MHISSISTSASIKTGDTSVVLMLQCLKMQACSLVIISVLSSCLMDILIGSLRIDDFCTTPPLGHVIVLRCRPVEI